MKTDKLTRRNFLKRVGLVGIVGFGVNGCGHDDKYHFDGEIDGEKVRFYEERFFNNKEVLEVIKKDGTKVNYSNEYLNSINPFKIIITKNNKEEIEYNFSDEIGKPILNEAKKQYNNYLEKILEEKQRIKQEKIQEGLDLIRK